MGVVNKYGSANPQYVSDIEPVLESYSECTSEFAKLLKTQDGVLGAGGSLLPDERNRINLSVVESIKTRISQVGLPTRFYSIGGTETCCPVAAENIYCLGLAQQINRLDPTDPHKQEKQLELKARYETLVAETGSDDLDIRSFLN